MIKTLYTSITANLTVLRGVSSHRAAEVVHETLSATYKTTESKKKLKAMEPNPPKLGNVRTEISCLTWNWCLCAHSWCSLHLLSFVLGVSASWSMEFVYWIANSELLLILGIECMIPGVQLLNTSLNGELDLLMVFSAVLIIVISGSHRSFNELIFTRHQWGDYLLFAAAEPMSKKSINSLQAPTLQWTGFYFSKYLAFFSTAFAQSHFPVTLGIAGSNQHFSAWSLEDKGQIYAT